MTESKKSRNVLTTIALILAAFVMVVQMPNYSIGLSGGRLGSILKYFPALAHSATLIFITMIFGAVYAKRKQKTEYADIFRYWLMAVVTLLVFNIAYDVLAPNQFKMWSIWGIFFPFITSSSIILSTILISLFFKPAIVNWLNKYENKQMGLILTTLTILLFVLSVGKMPFNTSIYALFLVLYFAWGMYLSRLKYSYKQIGVWVLIGIAAFVLAILISYGFSGIFGYKRGNWNPRLMLNLASPLMFLVANAAFVLFKPIIDTLKRKHLRQILPAMIFMTSPIAAGFTNAVAFTGSAKVNKAIVFIGLVILNFVLSALMQKYLFKNKKSKYLVSYLSQSQNPVRILEDAVKAFIKGVKKYKILLLTWGWFYVLTFISFIMQYENFRVVFLTTGSLNAFAYLLGVKFFTPVLATIFLYAIFAILYFVTTRYWISNFLASALLIIWAIANRIKLNLRGEPIYPSELSEATNAQSLMSFVNRNLLIIVAVVLVIAIIVIAYLEFKHPIKQTASWKNRGIWALLSLLLFVTPVRFNHETNPIHYISVAFDNVAKFANPERDLLNNGPLLNFLNYIDLQAMNKPNNYTKANVQNVMDKYEKIAQKINKTRKNDLSKQTIVFNLSESFVDPHTFPTIKLNKNVPNPVQFISSLKNKATYGTMLSAGYGGGTANMEWESLTGFNMGLFKTLITPYVQVVPHYTFYPTIGMNFSEASAIHPYIGSYYSRVENYRRFKFSKFVYLGSKYKIIDQKHLGNSPYNSDFTAYANGLKQINSYKGGQFINLISMQNHMPYHNWYPGNEYNDKFSGKLFNDPGINEQMATYIKGTQYTDQAVKGFIQAIDKIKKPITFVFYGDHYPSILPQTLTELYPVQMHSTRYFIYSNKYAREHGSLTKLKKKYKYVNTSDFIAMMLAQTNSKVSAYQALLTKIHEELPALSINFKEGKGLELINEKGKVVNPKKLTNSQQALLRDYKLIQYDMTEGKGYSVDSKDFYKN